jgi:hypothetical protein
MWCWLQYETALVIDLLKRGHPNAERKVRRSSSKQEESAAAAQQQAQEGGSSSSNSAGGTAPNTATQPSRLCALAHGRPVVARLGARSSCCKQTASTAASAGLYRHGHYRQIVGAHA